MSSNSDKIKGSVNSAVGKAKETAGKVINNKNLEAKGLIQEDKGDAQQSEGEIKKQVEKGTKAFGKAVKELKKKIIGKQ